MTETKSGPKVMCAAWDKSLRVEVLGLVWMRKAHITKTLGVLYRRIDQEEGISARDEKEFYRLFKEAK